MIVNIGLPGRYAATCLRVTVKRSDSPRIPGFFVAIFSGVTQFGVWPVGRCDCRMEFLGRTMSRSPAILAAALAIFHDDLPGNCLRELVADNPHDVSPPLWADVNIAYNVIVG